MFYVHAHSIEMSNKFPETLFAERFLEAALSAYCQSKDKTTFTHQPGRVILHRNAPVMSLLWDIQPGRDTIPVVPNMDFLAAGVYDDLGQV